VQSGRLVALGVSPDVPPDAAEHCLDARLGQKGFFDAPRGLDGSLQPGSLAEDQPNVEAPLIDARQQVPRELGPDQAGNGE
jgi:hypothetical protein